MSGNQRYTRELLAEAAARCTTIDEAIAFLGTRPYGRLRRYLFERFARFDIDVSHFPRRGPHGTILRPTREALRSAVADSTSIAGALRWLQRADNTRTRQLFRQWVTEDGVDTSHFLGQAHQRGKRSPQKRLPHQVLVKRSNGHRTRTVVLRAALRDTGVPERCAECGIGPEWRGKAIALEIDHINGDRLDDRAANLRMLCPNCHAITDTWCRGGGRRSRRR